MAGRVAATQLHDKTIHVAKPTPIPKPENDRTRFIPKRNRTSHQTILDSGKLQEASFPALGPTCQGHPEISLFKHGSKDYTDDMVQRPHHRRSSFLTTLPPVVLAAVCAVCAVEGLFAAGPAPTQDEARKIASAAPAKAAAVPKKPRKLLVFTLCRGYYHMSIPYGAEALRVMGQRTGAYEATITDDIAFFEAEKLKTFDGVCLMSALGEFFLPEGFDKLSPEKQAEARATDARLKAGFLDYLRGGGGLVGIHGSSHALPETPEFSTALGALFDSHPWGSTERIAIRLEEPDHPLLRVFEGHGFDVIDEGYQFKGPYSRKLDRVLYSMDKERMSMDKQNLRPDRDFGLCWVKRYGQGRVFYTALGHNNEEFWDPRLLRHILDGVQFSLGDLDVPSDPR